MDVLRRLRRALFVLFLAVCALVSLALVASQIEQRIFRRRAERLLAEVQSLELRKTPWPEALAKFQHWGANRKFSDQCDEERCSLQVTLTESVYGFLSRNLLFLRLDDYLRWRFKLPSDGNGPFVRTEIALLRVYMRMGGRPARIGAVVDMRDGFVWGKGLDLRIETYAHDIPGFSGSGQVEFTLFASGYSRPRLDEWGNGWIDPQLTFHPDYLIGRPGGCNVCVEGWAKFTPYANPVDIHRLLQLDLSCLTRWHPCRTQGDIMPAAWAQYLAEQPRVDALWGQLPCSPQVIEILGRDRANILTGEVLGYHDEVDSQGYHNGFARVRVQQRIKGATNWNVGETISVPASLPTQQEKVRPHPRLSVILFGGPVQEIEMAKGMEVERVCSYLPANETNLNLVRLGIDQDYSAADKPN